MGRIGWLAVDIAVKLTLVGLLLVALLLPELPQFAGKAMGGAVLASAGVAWLAPSRRGGSGASRGPDNGDSGGGYRP